MVKELKQLPSSNLVVPLVQVMFGEVGGDRMKNIGDHEAFTYNISVEEIERMGRDAGARYLRKVDITSTAIEISLEVMDQTPMIRTLMSGANPDNKTYYTQEAATGETVTYTNVTAGDVFTLKHRNINGVIVEDGSLEPLTQGVHFSVLEESGLIDIHSLPIASDGEITITYDAPEITSEDDKFKAGIASGFSFRTQVAILSVNNSGSRDMLYFPIVEWRVDGDISLSADEFASVPLRGTVIADTTQPSEFKFGYRTEIARG